MFKWIKIVSKLSRQDDVVTALEERVNGISSKAEQILQESAKAIEDLQKAKKETDIELERLTKSTEEFRQVVDDLVCKISEGKSDAEKISGEMESYHEAIAQKVEELRMVTHDHLKAVNEKVGVYDSNVAKLGKEIMRLGDSIAEFQKR